jgi:hypothetical protein
MPRAAVYGHCTKFSQIDSAYRKVYDTDCNGVGDSKCNGNKDE